MPWWTSSAEAEAESEPFYHTCFEKREQMPLSHSGPEPETISLAPIPFLTERVVVPTGSGTAQSLNRSNRRTSMQAIVTCNIRLGAQPWCNDDMHGLYV